jgi:aryl-alcohol dehydrogenase-like predicted oxidoreductase
MQVEQIDLIQLHNLVAEQDWQTVFAAGGALEALVEAREQGLVRFIGVTGHGTEVAKMHRRSLERFPFDSILLPYNFTMMSMPEYAADFERLVALCEERGVAVQTIKSVARRNWQDDSRRRFSWYEPLQDEAAIRRAVHFVLSRPGVFLNTSSDATLLRHTLSCTTNVTPPSSAELEEDVSRFAMQPLFQPGVPDPI